MRKVSLVFVNLCFLCTTIFAQWTVSVTPSLGWINTAVVRDSTIFLGAFNGQILRSTDTCKTWRAIIWSHTGAVNSIVTSGGTVFAGTDDALYYSNDNGETWKEDFVLTGMRIFSLVVNGTTLFAATGTGLYQSIDNGITWAKYVIPMSNNFVVSIAINGTTLFAGTDLGIYISTDNGKVWKRQQLDIRYPRMTVSNKTIFAGNDGLYRSTNNGETWINVSQIPFIIESVTVIGTTVFVRADGLIHRSSDDGLTWEIDKRQNIVQPLASIGSTIVGGGLYSKIYTSTNNGNTWEWMNKNNLLIENEFVYVPEISSFGVMGKTLFATRGKSVFRSTDTGKTWVLASSGFTEQDIRTLVIKDTIIFVGTSGAGVFRSTNMGETWISVNTGLIDQDVRCLASNKSKVFAGTFEGIFHSSDNGDTWYRCGNWWNSDIHSLNATDSTLFYSSYKLYRSNGYCDWQTDPDSELFGATSYAWGDTKVFIGTAFKGVYRSTDRGRTWKELGRVDHDYDFKSLVLIGNTLLSATGGKIYRSTDDGQTWTVILHYPSIALAFNETNLFVVTNDGGILKAELKDLITSIDDTPNQPTVNTWCYPNPTTDVLTVSIPSRMANSSGTIRYSIINLRGEELLSIDSESATASIPTNGIPSGTYTVVATRGTQRIAAMVSVVR
jgi:photosystem II stability/assembly factor-like uncharacterized protein